MYTDLYTVLFLYRIIDLLILAEFCKTLKLLNRIKKDTRLKNNCCTYIMLSAFQTSDWFTYTRCIFPIAQKMHIYFMTAILGYSGN